jgi:WD repeat-containing protein 19
MLIRMLTLCLRYAYAMYHCYYWQLDKKYRRNIEVIVRRPNREEEPEPLTNCPISGQPLPITALECPTTKDALPMCVVTGRHMERGDWCVCPVSRMPALLVSHLTALT